MSDPKTALDAWTVAKKALDDSTSALRAAEAGHAVAERCEAEAWAAIVALRGSVPNTQDPRPTEVMATFRAAQPIQTNGFVPQSVASWHPLATSWMGSAGR